VSGELPYDEVLLQIKTRRCRPSFPTAIAMGLIKHSIDVIALHTCRYRQTFVHRSKYFRYFLGMV
jgi:hypothetical protein